MTAKHTPDEWEYSGNTEVIGIRRVQTLEPICSIRPANYDHARLIAAAPEMLIALEKSLECFRAIYDKVNNTVDDEEEVLVDIMTTPEWWPLDQLRTAIRKARGE